MNWLDCLKKDAQSLDSFLEVLEAEKTMELNLTLASSTPDKNNGLNLDTLRGYIKALDKLKHLATIEDREKRSYEEYRTNNGLDRIVS